jgi:hypothetical protein
MWRPVFNQRHDGATDREDKGKALPGCIGDQGKHIPPLDSLPIEHIEQRTACAV